MTYANHFIYDVFKLGPTATHAIDVELRDRQCNRQDFTIPLADARFRVAELDAVSMWQLKAWDEPYECKFD